MSSATFNIAVSKGLPVSKSPPGDEDGSILKWSQKKQPYQMRYSAGRWFQRLKGEEFGNDSG